MSASSELLAVIQSRSATLKGGEWHFLCPAHEDHHPSARYNPDKCVWVCDACKSGGGWQELARRLGIHITQTKHDPARQFIASYDYVNESSELLYQVQRFHIPQADGSYKKDFTCRRPDGNGGWIWSMKDVRRVLFRLPELTGQTSVFAAVGELCVNQLWDQGLPATCNSGGAGKWTDELTQQLKAIGVQDVIILPDNDEPGLQHAQSIARSCFTAGLTAKIVALPNLPRKGDVSDFLRVGGTIDKLQALIEAATVWTPNLQHDVPTDETCERANDDRPELDCDNGDLDESTRRAWHAVSLRNKPPKLFRYGSIPSRIEPQEHGRSLRIVQLTPDRFRHHAAEMARWTRTKKRLGECLRVDCRPPMDVIKNMLAAPVIPLPALSGIVEVPVFAVTGRLVQHAGYDAEAGIIYHPYDSNISIVIPVKPTAHDLAAAKACLDEIISDFPFVSEADKAHAVALAILPFGRDMVAGPTPLHVIEAPGPGTGKNLLLETMLFPGVGRHIGVMAEARDDEEWRKRVTTRLREGCPVTVIDNLTRPLDSGTLSAVLTSRIWEDRLLGTNENIVVPNRTIWVCTANNPVLSKEIARRSIRIRLDPKMERPWFRSGFKHEDLRAFVERERAALVSAILTMVRGWQNAGCPRPLAKPLGSFESWFITVGGIVEFAGYKSFHGNALEFYETADGEGAIWLMFVTNWWGRYQGRTVSAKDLFDIATSIEGFDFGRGSTEHGQKTVLGKLLKTHRDQIVNGFRIQMEDPYGNGAQWKLEPVAGTTPEPDTVETITLT